jgi:hypothetical protein
MAELGPVEMLVIEFEGNRFKGEILPELDRLHQEGVVRIVDLLFVRKSESGTLAVLTSSDLDADELREFGSLLSELVGLPLTREREPILEEGPDLSSGHVFDKSEADELAAVIPAGSSAGIVLLEHTWAVPLRGKIARAGGRILSEEWINARRLAEIGVISEPAERNGNGHKPRR